MALNECILNVGSYISLPVKSVNIVSRFLNSDQEVNTLSEKSPKVTYKRTFLPGAIELHETPM